MEENQVNEEMETREEALVPQEESVIKSFAESRRQSSTEKQILTNIKDKKELYNLDNGIEPQLLNECVGEKIRVKKVLIKKYLKEMKEPVIDETTGEIVKDKEVTMSCLLVDDNGTSYATGSKTFTIQLINLIYDFGESILEEGLEIEIIKKKIGQNGNKALGFKLL